VRSPGAARATGSGRRQSKEEAAQDVTALPYLDDAALLSLVSGTRHEVSSPYDAAATAAALTNLLDGDRRARDA
jgi:hypothetical protein